MDDGRLNALFARADAARSEYIEATQPNEYGKPQGDWLPARSTYGQLANNVLELVAEVRRLRGLLAMWELDEPVPPGRDAVEFALERQAIRDADVRSPLNEPDPED